MVVPFENVSHHFGRTVECTLLSVFLEHGKCTVLPKLAVMLCGSVAKLIPEIHNSVHYTGSFSQIFLLLLIMKILTVFEYVLSVWFLFSLMLNIK